MRRDPLDGILFPSDGGYCPDGENISVDVPYLWAGWSVIALVCFAQAVLSLVAESRGICFCDFYSGIYYGLVFAGLYWRLSMGLWGQAAFRHGAHPAGLCAPLGGFGVVFRTGGVVSFGEGMGEIKICSLGDFEVK